MQIYMGEKINNEPKKEQGKRVLLKMLERLSSGYGIMTLLHLLLLQKTY